MHSQMYQPLDESTTKEIILTLKNSKLMKDVSTERFYYPKEPIKKLICP